MRYAVVFNPAAQNGRAGRHLAALEAAMRVESVPFDVYQTEEPGHATRLAREAAATADVVIAVGGDGTVQEVVQGVHGSDAALGVIPLGTGNDFAYALGMPEDLWEAVQALLKAPPHTIDLGRVRWEESGEHGALLNRECLFANCLGVGFDALVARNARRFKWMGGRTAYHVAVFRTLWSWDQPEVEVSLSMERTSTIAATAGSGAGDPPPPPAGGQAMSESLERLHSGRFLLLEIGNGFSVGGGFFLTPDARVDDGLLDVCLIDHATRRRIVKLLPTAFTGAHVHAPEVTIRQARHVTVRSAHPLPIQADGEALTDGARLLDVAILPGALRVLAPTLRRD